ncbi:MAG: ABC exporter membrane fusion protein [Spirulinaceae cyanobacterium]
MNSEALGNQSASSKLPRRWLLLLVVLGLFGTTAWGVWQFRSAQVEEAQTNVAPVPQIPTVTALGRLEPEGEIINLTASSSSQTSRIKELLIEEGDRVQPGQLIAVLDNRERLQATWQKAKEQVEIAETKLAQVEAGAKSGEIQAQRAEIARIEAEQVGNLNTQSATISRLEAEVQNARIEYQRYESLYQQGAISASDRDGRRLTYTTKQQQLQEAQAALKRIQTTSDKQITQASATLDQIVEVRPVDVAAAKAEVQSALAAVAEAKADLDQAEVRSPRGGQVIKIHTRPGEKIAEEGIATLGQTQQMMVVAEVYQSDINKVKVGQIAEIKSPVIPEILQGEVKQIGLQVERQQVVNEDPAANIDAKVIEVRIGLDRAASEKVAGLTNLQVTATIKAQ